MTKIDNMEERELTEKYTNAMNDFNFESGLKIAQEILKKEYLKKSKYPCLLAKVCIQIRNNWNSIKPNIFGKKKIQKLIEEVELYIGIAEFDDFKASARWMYHSLAIISVLEGAPLDMYKTNKIQFKVTWKINDLLFDEDSMGNFYNYREKLVEKYKNVFYVEEQNYNKKLIN